MPAKRLSLGAKDEDSCLNLGFTLTYGCSRESGGVDPHSNSYINPHIYPYNSPCIHSVEWFFIIIFIKSRNLTITMSIHLMVMTVTIAVTILSQYYEGLLVSVYFCLLQTLTRSFHFLCHLICQIPIYPILYLLKGGL